MQRRNVVFTNPWDVNMQIDKFTENIQSQHEIIIKNKYSLISPGTEMSCLSGNESWFSLPGTPGYAAVGEILEKGKQIKNLKVGDTVFVFGPHSEYFKINTQDRYSGICIKVPSSVSHDTVPFTRIGTIAMTSLRVSDIELGDYAAVIGMGLVGNLAAQLCMLQGARVIGIDINEKRLEVAKRCGIDCCVNAYLPDYQKQIKEITKGRGISTLIDATGISSVIQKNLTLVAPYGEVILLGSPRSPFESNLTDTLKYVHYMDNGVLSFKGAHEWRYPTFENEYNKHSIERNSVIMLDLLEREKINIGPLYTHKLKPEDCKKAYDGLRKNPGQYIGVIFDWNR
jgi:2-desacetyl-2-hydroxyethyl bacteriochlorophyllide A dehydrogenase